MLMEQYNAGVAEYQSVTARGVLYTLGFEDDGDQILTAIGEAGFNYCLDRTVATHDGEYPSQDVCWWGADQLESRLHMIDSRIKYNASR